MKAMEAAINGSTYRGEALTEPSVAQANVIECASVKQEMIVTTDRARWQTISRPNRKSR